MIVNSETNADGAEDDQSPDGLIMNLTPTMGADEKAIVNISRLSQAVQEAVVTVRSASQCAKLTEEDKKTKGSAKKQNFQTTLNLDPVV